MPRFTALLACSGVTLAASLLAPTARAAEGTPGEGESAAAPSPANAAAPTRLVLSVGTEFLLGMTYTEGGGGDVTVISTNTLLGWTASALFRITPAVSLGLRGGGAANVGDSGFASSSGEQDSYERHFWHLAVAGRYQGKSGYGPYASARAGVAAMIDSAGHDSVTQWAPLGDAALGYDFRLVGTVALGLELQAGVAGFDERGASYRYRDGTPMTFSYGTSSWLGLGLTGSFGI